MECVKWCQECNDFTKHNGKNRCNVCKSNRYRARKAEVPPDSFCASLVRLEETVYDIKKSLS